MSFKSNCIWYDETERRECHLCFHRIDREDGNILIEECPKNCGNYIHRYTKDKELIKKILQESAALALNRDQKGDCQCVLNLLKQVSDLIKL